MEPVRLGKASEHRLAKLTLLKDQGILTDAEFDAARKRVLASIR